MSQLDDWPELPAAPHACCCSAKSAPSRVVTVRQTRCLIYVGRYILSLSAWCTFLRHPVLQQPSTTIPHNDSFPRATAADHLDPWTRPSQAQTLHYGIETIGPLLAGQRHRLERRRASSERPSSSRLSFGCAQTASQAPQEPACASFQKAFAGDEQNKRSGLAPLRPRYRHPTTLTKGPP